PDSTGSFQANQDSRYLIQLDLTATPPDPSAEPAVSDLSRSVLVTFSRSGISGLTNDNFADRFALVGSTAVFTAALSAATTEVKEPEISSHVLHRTLWWTWESPGYGSAVIRKL